MRRIVLIVLVLLASGAHPVTAEDTPLKLDRVVVTASRYEEKVSSVPANVTVITEKDIANSTAQSIPDILRSETGIHVNDIAANKRNTTVDLRGFGSTAVLNTLVLVDGRKVNVPDLSGADWTQIPLDRVKRIEVIRGGQGSVLYGDNAAGGVINIITHSGDTLKGGGSAAAGSYETYKGSVFFSNSSDKASYSLNASYLNSDGYRDNSATEAKDAGMNITYYAGDSVNLNFSTGYHKDNTGLPGALKESDFAAGASRTDTVNPRDFAEVEDYYFKASPELYFLGDSYVKLDLSYRKRSSLTFSSFVGGNFTGDTDIFTTAFSPQVVLKHSAGKLDNSLSVGYDFQESKEDILNNSSFSGKAQFDLEKTNSSVYVHDELTIMDRLLVSGGYRYDRAEFSFDPSSPSETVMDEELHTLGVNYLFHGNSYAYASYSRSFRYPVLDELFNFISNTISTDLMPQKADNYEAGVRIYVADDSYVHANLFRIDTTDEILYNPTGGAFGFGANENLDGKTRRQGVELSLHAMVTDWLTINGNYSYIDAFIRGGQYEGGDIPNVPNHKTAAGIEVYPLDGLTVVLNGVHVGSRPFNSDFTNSFDRQENYTVLNSKIQYTWKQVTAFVDFNNITDEKYSEFGTLSLFSFPVETAVYPSPRFNMLLGVSVEI